MQKQAKKSRLALRSLLVSLLVLQLLVNLLYFAPSAQAAPDKAPEWKNTGYQTSPYICFDGSRPNSIITSPINGETALLNWKTGEKTPFGKFNIFDCRDFDEVNGQFFNFLFDGGVVRYNAKEPQGRPIDYYPQYKAKDGTLRYYDVSGGPFTVSGAYSSLVSFYTNPLHVSEDGGLTWQERGQQFNGKIGSLAVNEGDSKAIYIAVRDGAVPGTNLFQHSIYFSPDAGLTWQKRNEIKLPTNHVIYLRTPFGRSNPVSSLLYYDVNNDTASGADGLDLSISSDGGRSFNPVFSITFGITAMDNHVRVYHTGQGLLQIRFNLYQPENKAFYSRDGGKTWQEVKLPSVPTSRIYVQQSANLASLLTIQTANGGPGYYSRDGGLTWTKLFDSNPESILYISPYAPTTFVRVNQNEQLEVLELPEIDKDVTNPAASAEAAGRYYAETAHNISPLFQKYWESQGGLAQFGFPRTEPFREINPSDGQLYMVQYFERNRFEYHPENKGTGYEVLLGLLGNQLTQARRAKGELPFKPVAPPSVSSPDIAYFAETGHYLGYGFKNYWEANGGLAIYGLPVSEEFSEVNPDDGKTYTVQYFERARFEYHPEFQGTRYEVLLGLLGNALLRLKGWA